MVTERRAAPQHDQDDDVPEDAGEENDGTDGHPEEKRHRLGGVERHDAPLKSGSIQTVQVCLILRPTTTNFGSVRFTESEGESETKCDGFTSDPCCKSNTISPIYPSNPIQK